MELIAIVEIQLPWACYIRLVSRNCLFCAPANVKRTFVCSFNIYIANTLKRQPDDETMPVPTRLHTLFNYHRNRMNVFVWVGRQCCRNLVKPHR
jgi:hypothetical protein